MKKIFDGFKETKNNYQDISMHSEISFFYFKNDFGYDTLTVNFLMLQKIFKKQQDQIGSLNFFNLIFNLKYCFKSFLLF